MIRPLNVDNNGVRPEGLTIMKKLCGVLPFIVLFIVLCGCEEMRRNGRPGDVGYIAPKYSQVKVIEFVPEFITEVAGRAGVRQAYSVVEDEEGKRYRIPGKVGPVGDKFKMDVSLMVEISG
jgi:hypothetical protein